MRDWRHLRQQSFLSLSIIVCCTVIVGFLLPNMNLREAMVTIAVVALALGWMP